MGLALAQPGKRVVVATGDGELLMNLGSLATVAVMRPTNLAILCVDNGHYGETGYQRSHTARGVDLAAIATGSGIPVVRTVSSDDDIPEAASLIRQADRSVFYPAPGQAHGSSQGSTLHGCRVDEESLSRCFVGCALGRRSYCARAPPSMTTSLPVI